MSKRLRSRLIWGKGAAEPLAEAGERALETIGKAVEHLEFDMPVSAHERAVALLHLGAEIEHALMVQYLYAAYSLNLQQDTPERCSLVQAFRNVIVEIAREEMGHLASVQNILTLIGGPLCFEREDYPIIDPELWPYPFELEPLTKDSLAKYVLAEAPSDEVLEKLGILDEIIAIRRRLKQDENVSVNRVGIIYGDILKLFTAGPMVEGPLVPGAPRPYPYVATADIQSDSLPYQVSPGAWGLGYQHIIIGTAFDRNSALAALTAVSEQGEGPIEADEDHLQKKFRESHFGRFLEVYRRFPEQSEWSPSRPVATNPTTNQTADPGRLVLGKAALWAQLSNLRYRMLLLYLEHSFYIETPTTNPTRSPRGALITWSFGEMYNLRSLADILMSMPLRPGSDLNAGPPFEMPYTLSLPTRGVNRWRAHRDLLLASIALVDRMLALHPEHARYLTALRTADKTALEQIEALIGA